MMVSLFFFFAWHVVIVHGVVYFFLAFRAVFPHFLFCHRFVILFLLCPDGSSFFSPLFGMLLLCLVLFIFS
jgi:hypothetical protein